MGRKTLIQVHVVRKIRNAGLERSSSQNAAEKARLKYQTRINRPRCGSIHGSKRVETDEQLDSDDISAYIDDVIEMDINDD